MSVNRAEGINGLPKIVLSLRDGAHSAEVYLHGATITSYKHNHVEHIFVSDKAIFNGVKAIRGGVPLVFPQFSQPLPEMPQHGFLRTSSDWTYEEKRETSSFSTASKEEGDDEEVSVVLKLRDTEASRLLWPHAFEASLHIRLTTSQLIYQLCITNPEANSPPFTCHTLLHTYLRIPSIHDIKVTGFEGVKYLDKVASSSSQDPILQEEREVVFTSEVDRIYLAENSETMPKLTISVAGEELITTSKRAIKTKKDNTGNSSSSSSSF